MKKVVLKLDVYDEKAKQKALKTVSTIPGIDFIGIDVTQAQAQLTVIGTMDPVSIVSKLRKNWPTTDIIIVGPAIEPKKEEEKKDEPKKEETGKEDAKKEEEKKDEGKKDEEKKVEMVVSPELVQAYRAYYYPQMTSSYYVQSMEENPNACIIC